MIPKNKMVDMFKKMLTIRYFEEKEIYLFKLGEIGGSIY